MNQTRTMLWMAWLMLAAFLVFQWGDFLAQKNAPAPAAVASTVTPASSALQPAAAASVASAADTGLPTPTAAAQANAPNAVVDSASRKIRVRTDVLDVLIDTQGGSVLRAELLAYPLEKKPGSPNVVLFSDEAGKRYFAQSGWINAGGNAPDHRAIYTASQAEYRLAEGAARVEVPLTWTGANGLSLTKTFVFERGRYDIRVQERLSNAGTGGWVGQSYQQLVREELPPVSKSAGFTNPETFSFVGAAWYTQADKFDKRAFADFSEDGPLKLSTQGGWIAMLQHHFTSAWVPQGDIDTTFELSEETAAKKQFLIRGLAAPRELAAGATLSQDNVLWVGPKLQSQMSTVHPSLHLTLDYGIFSFIAQPLFDLLSWLHDLFGNWGWAIIGIVVLLKIALFWFSKKQYESAAKMRALQPRLEALKERYADDQQKYAMAQWELFQKEKVNPMSGCLPILIPIPIFFALYWVLLESVELRQAPWLGWIDNLTAPDPYFILPILNLAVMWTTQKLTPMPGMDPMQKKMMQWMPIVFGVLMLFFPSGLVLYWVTNGALGLAQQWWMLKIHAPQTVK